ncbi:hypothetical protein ACOMHN_019710 [Nucella lapillus]
MVFGGGDNDREFFSDLLAFTLPFNPLVKCASALERPLRTAYCYGSPVAATGYLGLLRGYEKSDFCYGFVAKS